MATLRMQTLQWFQNVGMHCTFTFLKTEAIQGTIRNSFKVKWLNIMIWKDVRDKWTQLLPFTEGTGTTTFTELYYIWVLYLRYHVDINPQNTVIG